MVSCQEVASVAKTGATRCVVLLDTEEMDKEEREVGQQRVAWTAGNHRKNRGQGPEESVGEHEGTRTEERR